MPGLTGYSVFSYNGITFSEPFQVLEHREQVILDGARNYLYTRHTFRIRANYNPQTTAYTQTGTELPEATAGTYPAITEAAVRSQLEQSRGTLLYQVAGDTIVQSPGGAYSVDANNGPVAVVHNVWERKGQKTFCCDFTVSTDINEASKRTSIAPVVTSHLWRMRNVVGDDGLTTRIIQGHIICRSDLLLSFSACPDDFRQTLAFPVPLNFKRISVDVVAAEDGNSCEYTVVDQEQFINLVKSTIVRIEASYRQTYSRTSAAEIAWAETKLAAGAAVRGIGALSALPNNLASMNQKSASRSIASIGTQASTLVGTAIDYAVQAADLRRSLAPRANHQLSCEMWGNSSITMQSLANEVQAFIGFRFTLMKQVFPVDFIGWTYSNWQNSMSKYAGASLMIQSGPLQVQAGQSVDVGTGFGMGFTNFAPDQNVTNWLTTGNAANPPLLGRGGVAGDYLGAVIAAQLNAQNVALRTPTGQGFSGIATGGRKAQNLPITGA